jgi:hypothetical protein
MSVNWKTKLPFHNVKVGFGAALCKLLLRIAILKNRRSRRILALPDKPVPQSALYKIAHRLGYRFVADENERPDVIIAWEDCTIRRADARLERLAATSRVINVGAADISKRRVAEVYERVFGYALKVDPRRCSGPILRKSDNNARHDGTIITAPVEPEPGYVYQRLINNTVDGLYENIRVPVFGSIVAYCLLQRCAPKHRFTLEQGNARLVEVDRVFTPDELALLRLFCREMGLDYGEIDVLRDADDGRLYVVDVNTTPFGPVNRRLDDSWWFDRLSWQSLTRLCNAFERELGPKSS